MNLSKEIKDAGAVDLLMVGKLTSAFTLLSQAPYLNWSFEGSPAELATWVVINAKKNGQMGMLQRIIERNS